MSESVCVAVCYSAAVCVTWSVSERVPACESAQGMGPVGLGGAGGHRQLCQPLAHFCAVKTSVFLNLIKKKARNVDRNL